MPTRPEDLTTLASAWSVAQRQQIFLLQLSEELRPLADPLEIQSAAARILHAYLGVEWVYYAEYAQYPPRLSFRGEHEGTSPSLGGTYPIVSFAVLEEMLQGRSVAIDDIMTSPLFNEESRSRWAPLGMRSMAGAPIVKGGKLIGAFIAAGTSVRDWADDTGLIEETAERTWEAAERARIEAALRESEEGLRMALDAGRMGTYRFDVRTGIEQWSDSEYEMLGLPHTGEPPTREMFLSVVHPDDLHLVEFTENDQRPQGTSLDSEFRIIRPDTGEVRYLTAHALARFGPDGKPVELIGVNQDVTEERRAREAQRATEERLQQFSEASSDVLWIRDAHSLQWEYLSPAFDKIYGLTRQDALRGDNYRSWLDLIMPEDRPVAEAAVARVRDGERAAFEYRIRRPDGKMRWLRNTDFPMRDETGAVTHIGGVGSDITVLKRAEEHQRVLLAELQHRVRNTLAVIRSIMRRTAETTGSKDDFFTHLDGRIAAFARIQSAVTRDPTRGVDLGLLIADELRVVGAQEGREVRIDGPPLALAPKAAETLGLAIHELATNAVKHGALASAHGTIEITWQVAERARLELAWIEHSSVAPQREPRRRGFGTEILERTLAYELKGSAQMEFPPGGFRCVIVVPLEQVVGPLQVEGA